MVFRSEDQTHMTDEYGLHHADRQPLSTTVLVILSIGVAYFIIGYVFGELDDLGVTPRGVFLWRLGAWVASGFVFAAHLWLETKRFHNPTLRVALHASLGVAFGAFLLAVLATFHAAWITSTAPFWRYLVALVAWPMFTAIPAFLCGLVVAIALNRFPKPIAR